MLLAGLAQVPAGETPVKAAASPATVQIDNFAFAPATLTVSAGTTVTWKNEDDSLERANRAPVSGPDRARRSEGGRYGEGDPETERRIEEDRRPAAGGSTL